MLTKHQQELRLKHITATDAVKIMGVDAYGKNASDVYLEKSGQLEKPAEESSEAMALGSALEPMLVDWAGQELNCATKKNQFRVARDGVMSATFDALCIGKREAIEAKTTGLVRYAPNELWGEAGTDQVPPHVIVQCMAQIAVGELDVVWIPCLIPGRGGRKLYRVQRNEELLKLIVDACHKFFDEHLRPGIPPAGTPSLEFSKALRRVEGKEIIVPDDVILAYRDAKAKEKAIKEEVELREAKLYGALGDATIGTSSLGTVTLKEIIRHSVDTKKLTADHPNIVAQYERASKYRRLIWREAKQTGGTTNE